MKKALKFLVDVGVGKNVETWFRSEGFDTIALRDVDPRMADLDAQKLASKEGRILITMDKDFGEVVYRQKQKGSFFSEWRIPGKKKSSLQ